MLKEKKPNKVGFSLVFRFYGYTDSNRRRLKVFFFFLKADKNFGNYKRIYCSLPAVILEKYYKLQLYRLFSDSSHGYLFHLLRSNITTQLRLALNV